MTKRFVKHNVLRYESLITGKGEIAPSLKFYALKKSIKGLLERGRAVIEASYAEARNPIDDFVIGRFAFDVVYLGRKSIKRNGFRHNLRHTRKEFISQPICIPYNGQEAKCRNVKINPLRKKS